jgi:peptidoglycan hydrolase CwlO-like protein
MSTAGKVLIVLVMLMTLVWVVLSAGVSRYNTNANTKIFELAKLAEDLQEQVKKTQDDVASTLTQTSQAQEKIDRERGLLGAKKSDLERARSQISDTLSSVKSSKERPKRLKPISTTATRSTRKKRRSWKKTEPIIKS